MNGEKGQGESMRVIERDEKENKFQTHTGAKETETEKNTQREN